MSGDVIKSFLMELGFKVDEKTEKRFTETVTSVTKGAAALAAGIQAAAAAVMTHVQVIAGQFDKLYFQSARVGASATSIKALSYGLRQSGASAEAASQSIENFGRALKTNPARYKLLERMGVDIRDANGNLRESTDLMERFGKQLAKLPEFKRYQYFEDWGIDDDSGRGLVAGVGKWSDEYKKKLADAGLDPNKAAEDGAKLSRVWTSLGESLSIIGAKFASSLFTDQKNPLESFITFLDKNGGRIASVLAQIASVILQVAEGMLKLLVSEEARQFFNTLLTGLGDVDEKTGAFTLSMDKLKVVLAGIATYFVGSWLKKMLGGVEEVGKGWLGLLKTLGLAIPTAAVSYLGIKSAQAADAAVPNAQKPGLSNHWDDEASGAPGGAGLGGTLKRGFRSLWEGGKRLFSGGSASAAEGHRGSGAEGRRGAGAADGAGGTGGQFNGATPPEGAGTYRPEYKLSEADLDQRVINTIAGEVSTRNAAGVDAVINNMMNRVGSKGWGPSANLLQVARAPGQYEGYRQATAKETEMLRARIRAIASGGVPDNTNGANTFRAGWYQRGRWWNRIGHKGTLFGGNRYAYDPSVRNGPYAPYETPKKPSAPAPVAQSATPQTAPKVMPEPAPQKSPAQQNFLDRFNGSMDPADAARRQAIERSAQKLSERLDASRATIAALDRDKLSRDAAASDARSWDNRVTTINMPITNNTTVAGASDPQKVASAIDGVQTRRHSDLYRNMRSIQA